MGTLIAKLFDNRVSSIPVFDKDENRYNAFFDYIDAVSYIVQVLHSSSFNHQYLITVLFHSIMKVVVLALNSRLLTPNIPKYEAILSHLLGSY